MTLGHIEEHKSTLEVQQILQLESPQEMPSAVVTIAEWTQLCEAVDAVKAGNEYLRLFWSGAFGAMLAGISATMGTLLGGLPPAAWTSSLIITVVLGVAALLGFLLDRRFDDSVTVRIRVVQEQINHIERLRPTLAQRLQHPKLKPR
ncbi:MAG: hypothetical protein Q8P50_02755 [Bacillota bacterium]|nr:hypothetical protein [Bacillota bacterium]